MASSALADALGDGPADDRGRQPRQRLAGQPVRLRIQRRVADRIGKAERIEPRRQVAEAADGFRQIERRNGRGRVRRANAFGGARVADSISGDQVANSARVASSTLLGSAR